MKKLATIEDAAPAPASYVPPEPVPEHPPLMDALTAHVLWHCAQVQESIKRVDEMQDHVDR